MILRPALPPVEAADRAALSLELLAAACALQAMDAGQRLAAAIVAQVQQRQLSVRSRAAVQDISFATVRRLGWANALAAQLNRKRPDEPLYSLQRVALIQLDRACAALARIEPGVRHPAVIVDQAVHAALMATAPARDRRPAGKLAAAPRSPQASFLNATLRRFLREREPLNQRLAGDAQAEHNFPQWWLSELQADHPDHWQAIVAASNAPPPLCLRVNQRQIARDAYLEQLAQAGVVGVPLGRCGIAIAKSLDVTRLPGFQQGLFSVQDGGAQLAGGLLDLHDGQIVLDACAAPGGKAAHILELADVKLLALDLDRHRLGRIQQNLDRLRLRARVLAADATDPAAWWDGVGFDRILIDAPCSASGVVRRHPDIRWLRKRGDIATLCQLQRRLLEALWPLLKPGGKLLYATCSVFRAEGEYLVASFSDAHSNCFVQSLHWNRTVGMSLSPSNAPAPGAAAVSRVAQLLPTDGSQMITAAAGQPVRDHDGFCYALLEKKV